MTTYHKNSFIKGAGILAASSILVKIIGILYRIPLNNILGPVGTGIYQSAYPVYTLLLIISTAGLPPAVSNLVAARRAKNNLVGARKVFRVSLLFMSLIGLICSVLVYFFSTDIANFIKDPNVILSIQNIAPAIFLVAAMSSVRGYFQGLQDMKPTAITQLFEQIVKICVGLYLARLLKPRGIEYAAAGAMMGIVIAEAVALLIIVIYYALKAPTISKKSRSKESSYNLFKELSSLAVPILIGASIMPIVNLTDAFLIRRRLMHIGYVREAATGMLGLFSGYANTLINVPGSISLALCISMVPAISAAIARKDESGIKRNTRLGFKLALLVGIPSAVGLAILAHPIMDLLYSYSTSAQNLHITAQVLQILAAGIIFLSILQTFNGILQGMKRVYVPIIALAMGAVTKIIIEYVLVAMPHFNIYGAAISTVSCYLVAAIIDIIMVKKFTNVKFSQGHPIIKIILASTVMGAFAWACHSLLGPVIGSKPATIITVISAIPIFIISSMIFKVLVREEWQMMPGKKFFIKLYDKLHTKTR